jgi:hypothetical protein
MSTSNLRREAADAAMRIQVRLNQHSPWLAREVRQWMSSLSRSPRIANYFVNPTMFPMLHLPGWLAHSKLVQLDEQFQSDLTYSTLNGYLYIRLIDNLMDRHSGDELRLLPITALFHSEFLKSYHRYFAFSHMFWTAFDAHWTASTEVVIKEATLQNLDYEQFRTIAANKLCAAKIPLVATVSFYGLQDVLPAWLRFFDHLACCWQFADDLYDWKKDLLHGTTTYFLTEAARRKREAESVEGWVIREGFAWGSALLQSWLPALWRMVDELGSPQMNHYLRRRAMLLHMQTRTVLTTFESLQSLSGISVRA